MPTINAEIAETANTIVRPLVIDVARNVVQRTGLDIGMSIFLPKEYGGIPLNRTAIRAEDEPASFDQRSHLELTIEERPMEDATIFAPHFDYPSVFKDTGLDVWIKPVLSKTELVINFRQVFDSEALANTWYNGIRRRIANERQHNKHTAEYHYPIPKVMMYALFEIHKLREKRMGYGESVGKWFKQCFTEQVTPLTNQAGTAMEFHVKETQTGMNGWFDFQTPPTLAQENQRWYAEFSYILRFDKPISMGMHYPLLVHNQLIPQNMRLRGENFNELKDPGYSHEQRSRYDRLMQSGTILPGETIGGVSLPAWDEWLPSYVKSYHSTLLRLMVMLRTDDSNVVGDLGNLGHIEVDEDIRAYMIKHHDKLTQAGKCAVHVVLYSNDDMMGENAISIDENLIITANFDLDIRKRYHVWVGMLYDLTCLTEDATNELLEDGETTKKVVGVIDNKFPTEDIPVMEDGSISLPVWNGMKDVLPNVNKHFRDGVEINCMTVGNFTVATRKG